MTNTPTTPASVASRLTVEDIVREMRERENLDGGERVDNFNIDLGEYGEFDGLKLIKAYADAIESAWQLEKAELRECLKNTMTAMCNYCRSTPEAKGLPCLHGCEAMMVAKRMIEDAEVGES